MVFDSESFRPAIPIASPKWAIIPGHHINELLIACLCFAGSEKCPLLVFFCTLLFTLRSSIRLQTQEVVGLQAKTNRESSRNPVDELSSQHTSRRL